MRQSLWAWALTTSSLEPYSMTNRGLCISLMLSPLDPQNDIYIAALASADDGYGYLYGVFLRCISNIQKQFARIRTEDIVMHYDTAAGELLPETVYITPPSHSNYNAFGISAYLHWHMTLPDFCSAAAPKLTREESSMYGLGLRSSRFGNEHVGILYLGETRALSYLIEVFNARFFVLLRYTEAGRCLFRIERENGSTGEALIKEWNPSRWEVIRPWPSGKPVVVEHLAYGQNKFEIAVFVVDSQKFGLRLRLDLKSPW